MKISDFNNLIAKKDLQEVAGLETVLSQKKKRCIKKGEKVKFIKLYHDCYGTVLVVEYDGRYCYVKPEDFDGNYLIHILTQLDIRSMKKSIIYEDRFGKRYILREGESKLEYYEIY